MNHKQIIELLGRLSLVSLFVASQARAVEVLTEASSANPQEYLVLYTGHCAPRVGMKVISGRQASDASVDGLVIQASQSVKHLLAKCPQLEEVHVDVRSSQTPTLASYFTMAAANGWAPSDSLSNGELKSLLEDADYQAFAGPRPIYSKAYWRFARGRFDVVYGNDLENRMVATHVERGASDYRLKGQVYDLGYNESGLSCASSREGYALWGSFSMTVSTQLASLPISIKWCAEADGAGKVEDTEFFALSYGASLAPTIQTLSAQFAGAASLIDVSDEANAREPLIDREFYRVYATQDDICTSPEFDVIYRVNHERRDSVFAGDYQKSVSNIVSTLASRRCGSASRFVVNAYSQGDTEPWDQITFTFDNSAGAIPFRVARRNASAAAEAFDAFLEANRFGPCEGPFCELSGGRYLNAVYRGDLDVVKQIDALHREALYAYINKSKTQLGLDGRLDGLFDPSFDVNKIQLLEQVANKYMHAYGLWGDDCLDPGSQEKRYEYTTPVIIETDEYGTSTSGGITFDATYTLNPEFFPLRDKLASYRGAKTSDDPSNLEVKGSIYRGVVELNKSDDCRSAQVKEFERQLRVLTEALLQRPGITPPTDAVRPPEPERIVGPAFTASANAATASVTWNAPAALPSMPTATSSGERPARPMNEQQRMAKMGEEMTAAQNKLEADMTAIQTDMAKAQRQGASPQKLMQMMQASQATMMQLQQEFQKEMARIQQRYQ